MQGPYLFCFLLGGVSSSAAISTALRLRDSHGGQEVDGSLEHPLAVPG